MDIETLPRTRHPEKAHRPDNPILRKPSGYGSRRPYRPNTTQPGSLCAAWKLTTVCEEAGCPNIGECWTNRHATFMIMGDICTRACAFCNVATGKPVHLDPDEPRRVGEAVATLGLQHVVVTSVDRDDLEDGGARHFARTIAAIRETAPKTTIEILTPDFKNRLGAIETILQNRPDVFNHNLETVPGCMRRSALAHGIYLFAASARVKEGRSGDVHQVRDYGRAGRDPARRFCR